ISSDLSMCSQFNSLFFFFQAEDGIRYRNVTGVQTCALPILVLHQCCCNPVLLLSCRLLLDILRRRKLISYSSLYLLLEFHHSRLQLTSSSCVSLTFLMYCLHSPCFSSLYIQYVFYLFLLN